jgi:hypothetical protein
VKTRLFALIVTVSGMGLTQIVWGDISRSYVTNGLVVWFDGIENAGPGSHSASPSAWYDLTGGGNHGTISSSSLIWGETGWINADDGVPIRIETSAVLDVVKTKTFTLEIAITPSRSSARQAFYSQYLASNDYGSSSRHGFSFEHNASGVTTGALRLFFDDRPNWVSSSMVAANEAAAVSAVVTPSVQKFFKGGSLAVQNNKSITAPANELSPADCSIVGGDLYRPEFAFRGTYHAFRCYDRALTPEEIAINAASDRVRLLGENVADVNLPGGYEFDENTNVIFKVVAAASTAGGRVSMDGGAAALSASVALFVNETTNVTFTATAQPGSTFLGWEGDVYAISAGSASDATVTVTASRGISLIAMFDTPGSIEPVSAHGSYVTDGLVCWMDGVDNAGFGSHDANAATWTDLSGNGNSGTMGTILGNGLTWTDFGWSNSVDGQPVTMPIALSQVLSNHGWTLEFAVTPSRSNVRQSFLSQYDAGGFSIEHNQGGVSSGALRLYYNNNPNYLIDNAILPANVPSVVSLASEPTVQDVRFNGVNVFTGSSTATAPVSTKQFYVGGDPTRANMSFRGTYHAFRVYNRILSAAERRRNAWADMYRFRDASGTWWTNSAGTAWLDAANWSVGMPNLHKAGFICADTPSLSLTVPPGVPALTNLTVVNATGTTTVIVPCSSELSFRNAQTTLGAGSRLEVRDGGALTYDGAGKTFSASVQTFGVSDGGELRVAGGDVTFTNFTGRLYVSGGEGETGRVTMTSGTLKVAAAQASHGLRIGTGGRLEASGGRIEISFPSPTTSQASLTEKGGEFHLSGTAQLVTTNTQMRIGSGRSRLSGNAVLREVYVNGNSSPTFALQSEAGVPCELTVDDSANIFLGGSVQGTLYIGNNVAGAPSILNWNSSQTFTALNSLCVGFRNSVGILNVSNGCLEGGSYGFRIAQPGGGDPATDFSTGIVNIVNGTIRCRSSWSSASAFNGLIVGAGNSTVLTAPGFYRGTLNVMGGNVESTDQYLGVGIGVAEGDIVQAGGKVSHTSGKHVVIGAWGGEGRWSMTNGVAELNGDVYVGGVLTNNLLHAAGELYLRCPVTNHTARGSLTVAGGTFSSTGKLHSGEDGTATIALGPTGTLSVAAADLANTALSVKFGQSGTGILQVAGDITIGQDVTLEVDTTEFTGRSGYYPLITFGGMLTGNFQSVRMNGHGALVQATIDGVKGYYLDLRKGMCILFK